MKKGADEATIGAAMEKWNVVQAEKSRREGDKKARRRAARKKAATASQEPQAAAAEAPARTRTADLEPLGFKVPPQFNQEFRRFAFENGYKLNELLFAAFDAFKKARIRESANS